MTPRQEQNKGQRSNNTYMYIPPINVAPHGVREEGQHHGTASYANQPPLPQIGVPAVYTDIPPLAVYHICRVCLRTRSATYHREHPIPLNAVPPPPGICRRCRVTTIEEISNVAKVTTKHESNDIKLGVKCLVPDEDILTNEEMKALRNENRTKYEPQEKRNERAQKRVIRYRYVEIARTPSRSPTGAGEHETHQRPPISDRQHLEYVEKEVRRIAREEVERYRQAERRVEAHASPYTHGNMAAIERNPKPNVKYIGSSTWLPKLNSAPTVTQEKTRPAIYHETGLSLHGAGHGSQHSDRQEPSSRTTHNDQHKTDLTGKPSNTVDQTSHPSCEIKLENAKLESDPFIHIKLREVAGNHSRMGSSSRSKTAPEITSQHVELPQEPGIVETGKEVKVPDGFQSIPPPPSSFCAASIPPVLPDVRTSPKAEAVKSTSPPQDIKGQCKDEGRRPQVHQSILINPSSAGLKGGRSTRSSEPSSRHGRTLDQTDKRRDSVVSVIYTAEDLFSDRRADILPATENIKDTKHGKPIVIQSSGSIGEKNRAESHIEAPAQRSLEATEGNEFKQACHRRPPYPSDEDPDAISMPSPTSYSSRIYAEESDHRRKPVSRPPRCEYIYVERVVRPASRPEHVNSYEDTPIIYYREKRKGSRSPEMEHVRRDQAQLYKNRREHMQRPAGVWGHVRFSNKVDISPTPPCSDASSEQFRVFHRRSRQDTKRDGFKRQEDPETSRRYQGHSSQRDRECSRSRSPLHPVHGSLSSPSPGFRRRNRTPHPAAVARRQSGDSRPLGPVLSESPSRERLRCFAKAGRVDGAGPYRHEEQPSASVVAEDGSGDEMDELERGRQRPSTQSNERPYWR